MLGRSWVWGALLVLGCAEEPLSYDEARSVICADACSGFQRCGFGDSSCVNACIGSYDPRGIRADVLVRVGDCVSGESCETLASDAPFSACFDEVAATEPLRPTLLDYCEDASLAYFSCDIWWEVEECASSMSIWEDSVLERSHACHGRPCDDLDACEEQAFR